MIDDLRVKERVIVVNDVQYRIAPATRLAEGERGRRLTPEALQVGRWVSLRVVGESSGTLGTVVELELLRGPSHPSPE